MLTEGDVRVTVTNARTDEHITVRFKALMDNRPRGGNGRPKPEENRNWIRVPLRDATHVFMEVPRPSGEFADKIGGFYPKTGRFFPDDGADPERVEAAIIAARWLNEGENASDRVGRYFLQEEAYCGKCGRTLTDPESIARGIGPECFGQMTDSQHQVKQLRIDPDERELISEILEAIHDLSEAGQRKVHQELAMWFSQGR